MDKEKHDDAALDALFSAAAARPERPSDDFMARLADQAIPAPPPAAPATPPSSRAGWLTGFFAASGLSGAAVLGVWIGFVMPEALDTFSLSTDDTVALSTFLPGADLGAALSE
ncbi:MAG: hypothetical protein HKN18_17570 [Silicimonas sp.]|nr:hypothetical protein [Silicimonas sp.]